MTGITGSLDSISPFWAKILATGELHAHRTARAGATGRGCYYVNDRKHSRKCGTEDCERLPLSVVLRAAREAAQR